MMIKETPRCFYWDMSREFPNRSQKKVHDGWTLLDSAVLWVCVLEALGLICEGLFVPGVVE